MPKKSKGQVLILGLILLTAILFCLALVLYMGKNISDRIRLQNAVDAATLTAAVWQARGLNVISDLNYALLIAAGGDITKLFSTGDVDFELVKGVQKMQDDVSMSMAGAAALAGQKVFKENDPDAQCYPFPASIKDGKMYSLRVKRYMLFGEVPLHMVKDKPDFWENQAETGPLIRLVAVKDSQPIRLVSRLLGKSSGRQVAVAQALPYLTDKNEMDTGGGGGLWNPVFNAKLVPLSVSVEAVNLFITAQ